MTADTENHAAKRAIPGFRGLSGRLLILTILFVMLAEVLIWAPSMARFRKVALESHMETAHLAALALRMSKNRTVSRELERQLLFHAEARGILLKGDKTRMMMLLGRKPPKPDVTVDLDNTTWPQWLMDAFEVFARDDNRVIRIVGASPKEPGVRVEVLVDEAPLHAAMLDFSTRVLRVSLGISIFTALLVFLALHRLVVRPVRDMTKAMIAFREAPEDEGRIIEPGNRADEIGLARCELGQMQRDIQVAIKQQSRLAMLGAAVAKINHDLRNSLATAVLAMEKITGIDDPDVKDATPKLYGAIDRAVSLCGQTLSYVVDEKPALNPRWFHLSEVVAEVQTALRDHEAGGDRVVLDNTVPIGFDMEADRAEIYRAIFNLVLNAAQAGATMIVVAAEKFSGMAVVRVADNGPGLPRKAVEKMFQPFAGSARKGGVGLGLVIARDAMLAHGGDIALERTGPNGTAFVLTLPEMRPGGTPPVVEEEPEDDEETGILGNPPRCGN